MKNSIKVVLAVLFVMFLLTACTIKNVQSIIIDDKSDVEVVIITSMDNDAIDTFMSLQSGDTNEEGQLEKKEHTDAEKWVYLEKALATDEAYKDFKKEKYEEGEFKGYRLSKNYGNIEKCSTTEKDIDYSKALQTGKLFIKDGDKYTLKLTTSSANAGVDEQSKSAGQDLSEIMAYSIVVSLPVEATKNNATTVSEDKKTYIWDALKADSVELEFKLEEKKEEEPEEDKWCNKFQIQIDAPKAGEKPATKAKALNEEFTIGKIYWTAYEGGKALDTAVEKFDSKYDYEVKIMVEPAEGYKLRSDYFGEVNGNQAHMPVNYEKGNFYVSYLFERDTSDVVWSNASKWAIDELTKAKSASLIPDIFNKEDLTKNITRREFAHVAVKLYNKISDVSMIQVYDNPFTDTDDPIVVKAYGIGITKGMSDTTFEPDTLITREQMATMLTRALAEAKETLNTTVDMSKVTKFADDENISSWAKDSVYFMSSVELIKGVGENKFDPKANASREQSLLISVRGAEKYSK